MQEITFSLSNQDDAILLILLAKRLGAVLVEQKTISSNDFTELENQTDIEITPVAQTFEEWNQQFEDQQDLSEFLPEFEMTLGSFRKQIWEAEMESVSNDTMSLAEFEKELTTWK